MDETITGGVPNFEGVGCGVGVGVADGLGVGVADGEGEGVGVADGDGVGVADGEGEGVGVADGEGVGAADGDGVGVADGEGEGVGVAEGVGVGAGPTGTTTGNVVAATLRSITSSDCGSVNVTSVPRPKITRVVSSNSPAAFFSNCTCWASARSGSLPSGRKPWKKSEVSISRFKSTSTGSDNRVASGLIIIIWPGPIKMDSPSRPFR